MVLVDQSASRQPLHHPPAEPEISPVPDTAGHFGDFGGRFVPEALMPACLELEEAFRDAWSDDG